MDRLRLFFKRAPGRVRDAAFALACRVLLPIATTCKVCNMLRGIVLGILLGAGIACLAIAPFIHHWMGC
jgi:hypothetical protein